MHYVHPYFTLCLLLAAAAASKTASRYQKKDGLPICKDGEHVEGEWVRVAKSTRSYGCVGHIGNDMKLRGQDNYTVPCRGCECDTQLDAFETEQRLMYEWAPYSCSLQKWDSKKFCDTLGNRTVLFIGDSTMLQTAVTMMNSLSYANASCVSQMYFGRSNYLVFDSRNEVRWNHYWEENPTDIIVLGAGPWYSDIGDLHWALAEVANSMRSWRSRGMRLPLLFWKTVNPAHMNCDQFMHPVSTYEERLMNLTYQENPFHWELFKTFDDISRAAIREIGGRVLDMAPLRLRPDAHPGRLGLTDLFFMKYGKSKAGHPDCLHYCLPGPIDIFRDIFLTALLAGSMPA